MSALRVGYAYPTSSLAEKFGFSKEGCWTVDRRTATVYCESIAGFASKQGAQDFIDAYTEEKPPQQSRAMFSGDGEGSL